MDVVVGLKCEESIDLIAIGRGTNLQNTKGMTTGETECTRIRVLYLGPTMTAK